MEDKGAQELESLENLTESLGVTQALLAKFQGEMTEATAAYDRKITRLTRMIQQVEDRRDSDPAVVKLDTLIDNARDQAGRLEEQAKERTLAAWRAGAFGDKKRYILSSGAMVEVRETVSREIADPVAFLDQVREDKLADELISGVKVSVHKANFNKYVDLRKPKSVVVTTEARAYVRL
jgi:hypothetical protein